MNVLGRDQMCRAGYGPKTLIKGTLGWMEATVIWAVADIRADLLQRMVAGQSSLPEDTTSTWRATGPVPQACDVGAAA